MVLAWSVGLENNLKYKCKLAIGILQVIIKEPGHEIGALAFFSLSVKPSLIGGKTDKIYLIAKFDFLCVIVCHAECQNTKNFKRWNHTILNVFFLISNNTYKKNSYRLDEKYFTGFILYVSAVAININVKIRIQCFTIKIQYYKVLYKKQAQKFLLIRRIIYKEV